MRRNLHPPLAAGLGLVLLTLLGAPQAQGGSAASAGSLSARRALAANVIIPQSRAVSFADRSAAVELTGVEAGVTILEQVAATTLDISLRNPTNARLEAELLVPVPDGAAVRSFFFEGAASEPTAEVLPKDEARHLYEGIVAKARDPALLEFAGYHLIRSSVFPVEPRGTQKVRLTYERLLTADGARVDYVLPRSESLEYRVPWKLAVSIWSKRAISTVYSPSHAVETLRRGPGEVTVRLSSQASAEPGSFRLSYLFETDGVSASLLAYPDPKVGGGYFLLLAGLPAVSRAEPPAAGRRPAGPPQAEPGAARIPREVTLVLDRSGSMGGEKIRQVRDAAVQIIEGLEPGEYFNLMLYNETVDSFSPAPVAKNETTVQAARDYIRGIQARGGTNLHDALLEALRQKPSPQTLPLVLFLTDGLPTVGQTAESAIRAVATQANPFHRRIFTFGVGVDVNTPLLDNLATDTRATATFVLPHEDVEVKVGQVFRRLKGPVLADPELRALDVAQASSLHEGTAAGWKPALQLADGATVFARTRDILPARLPDLFEGDQLVLLGQYVGAQALGFQISGNYLGRPRTFRFQFAFGLEKASTRNAFVPRLWASRKIGMLSDAIRQLGADNPPFTTQNAAAAPHEARAKELVEEIVRLSREFGILTEYTAFLAREGTNLGQRDQVLAEAYGNFKGRAFGSRAGMGSLNQEANNAFQRNQSQLNADNRFYDEKMNRVQVTSIQQVNDSAFYNRRGRWIDSRIVEKEETVQPKKTIEFGSEEFFQLAQRLADEGRQGSIALHGDITLLVDGEPVLVKAPAAAK